MSHRFYELLGRATWALGKRQMKQRIPHVSASRAGIVGALAIGVIGFGALAARSRASE
jgi:hypothetical protein